MQIEEVGNENIIYLRIARRRSEGKSSRRDVGVVIERWRKQVGVEKERSRSRHKKMAERVLSEDEVMGRVS